MPLEINLTGKRALVTGGNTGIGAAIVQSLAAAGARVAINYMIQPEETAALVQALEQKYEAGCAIGIPADIRSEEKAEGMVSAATGALGGLDILVNNAGVESTFAAIDLPVEEWDRILDTNLRAAFLCARAAARQMIRQGTGGVIINNQSIHDTIARKGAVHYAVSKAGLQMLTKMLALEWAENGIRVVGVSPGAIDARRGTPAGPLPPNPEEFFRGFEEWIPLGRFGKVTEVADAVAFLASDLAAYISGTTLTIDGAYSINLVRYDQRKWVQP